VLIVGIGGQGVITLGKILAAAGQLQGYDAIGCENKGGAQRGGRASSLIRFRSGDPPPAVSTRLASGQLDTLLALDLYEAARVSELLTDRATAIVNRDAVIPILARHEGIKTLDAEAVATRLTAGPAAVHLHACTAEARERTGDIANTNLVLLAWAMRHEALPLTRESILAAAAAKGLDSVLRECVGRLTMETQRRGDRKEES
jgi:Pyruvate/2-oxoacid:ferredoxin oxidoreductase gamma subunit